MNFPEPVISVAVEPKTKEDQEKMGVALGRLAQEDPSFRLRTDEESGQTIMSGMGELHLEIVVNRLKREFGLEVYQSKVFNKIKFHLHHRPIGEALRARGRDRVDTQWKMRRAGHEWPGRVPRLAQERHIKAAAVCGRVPRPLPRTRGQAAQPRGRRGRAPPRQRVEPPFIRDPRDARREDSHRHAPRQDCDKGEGVGRAVCRVLPRQGARP